MVVEYTTFGGGGLVGLILSGCTSHEGTCTKAPLEKRNHK